APFTRLMMRVFSPLSIWCSRFGRLRSSSSIVGNRHDAAMISLAAEPSDEGPHEQTRIQPISLRATVVSPYWDAGRMKYVHFDAARRQPPRSQKPSRPASYATTIRVIARPTRAASFRIRQIKHDVAALPE